MDFVIYIPHLCLVRSLRSVCISKYYLNVIINAYSVSDTFLTISDFHRVANIENYNRICAFLEFLFAFLMGY